VKHLFADSQFAVRVGANEIYARIGIECQLHRRVRYACVEEVVIVITDLYLTNSAEAASIRGVNLPGLARVARYGNGQALEQGWRSWLATWSGNQELALSAPATVAAAASRTTAADANGRMMWIATPVHLVAGLASVHMDARGLLKVEPDVRRDLAQEFNNVFGESGFRLEALPSAGFLLTGPRIGDRDTVEPARVLGASITEVLPEASSAPRLRRLLAEIEMWLHGHRVNAARQRAGRLPITALWLWGGGTAREGVALDMDHELLTTDSTDTVPASVVRGAALAATATPAPGVAFGSDPFLHGLWRACGSNVRNTPASFDEVLGHTGRRAVFVLELSHAFNEHPHWTLREALADLDRRWIVGALEALRRRDIGRVTVVANDHKLSLGTRDPWKLWRMPRPALTALQ
jgi:hypothetical protein